ncbi:hypothetical protein B6U83_00130 [Thermoplasmatales archaeon ex4484_36]|nr:MAG: hypothetical protein B6U83_00130 [Thermoplasmatales archaeon ex4484_36]
MDKEGKVVAFRPDGTLFSTGVGWMRPCGERVLLCYNHECPHKDECPSYDKEGPQVTFEKIGEEAVLENTETAFYNINIRKCDVCKHRDGCKRKKIPKLAKKCSRFEHDKQEAASILKEWLPDLREAIYQAVSDYNLARRLIKEAEEEEKDQ